MRAPSCTSRLAAGPSNRITLSGRAQGGVSGWAAGAEEGLRSMQRIHPHVLSTYRATSIEGTIPADVTDDARRRGRHFRAEWSAHAATDPMSHTPVRDLSYASDRTP